MFIINKALPAKLLYQLFTFILTIGLLFSLAAKSNAQTTTPPNFAKGKVISLNGTVVECEGGLAFDLANVELTSQIGSPVLSDLVPGSWVTIEGELIAQQSTNTRTFFRASDAYVELKKDILISGPIQSVDRNRNSVTILGEEIFFDGATQFLKKKKKKLKQITFNELSPGSVVTIEAIESENGMTARKVTSGLAPYGNEPHISGFIKSFNNDRVELVGGYVIDYTFFKLNNVTLENGVRMTAGVWMQSESNPLKTVALSYSGGTLAFNAVADAIDVASRTITVAGRQIKVDERDIFGDPIDLSKLQVGKLTSINGRPSAGGLTADFVGQFE
jgi:hypothetical protein